VGGGVSLELSAGVPRVSYYDVTNGKLKFAECTAGCATATPTWAFMTVADGGDNSAQSSLRMAGAVPMVSYYDSSPRDLKLAVLTGAAPALQLSATSLDFGIQSMTTTSAAQTLTITNTRRLRPPLSPPSRRATRSSR
jgi:hypothetical protein